MGRWGLSEAQAQRQCSAWPSFSVDQDPPEGPPSHPKGPPEAPSQGQVQVFTEASRFHSRTCSIIKTSGV